MTVVLENLVLSQHFAVATKRFDDRAQRLITLEENGLEALIDKDKIWRPQIAADRLATMLSLLSCCGLIVEANHNGDVAYSAA